MFERLLEPGCTESPTCQCGKQMEIAAIERFPEGTEGCLTYREWRGLSHRPTHPQIMRVILSHYENREYFFAIWQSLAPASQFPCGGSFH